MSTQAVARREPSSALEVAPDQSQWSRQQLAALHQIGVEEAAEGDLQVFLNFAQRTGLDPFARQIYMIGRWDRMSGRKKWTIQASIDGLRIVAQRSGEYAGQVGPEWCGSDGVWRDVWLESKPPVAARVGVLRRGFSQPLYAVALMSEYMSTGKNGQPSGLWGSKPAVMIAKCAEALALRKAFPMDLSGLYVAEEMAQADAPDAPAVPQVAPPPAEPVVQVEGRDWRAEVEAATDADTLRVLYRQVRDSGEPEDVKNRALAAIAEKGKALTAEQADEGVVDAEVVEDVAS